MPDWKPPKRSAPESGIASSVNGYCDQPITRRFLNASHSDSPMNAGIFLIGVCTGSGGSDWKPNSVDQTVCRARVAKRFLLRSLSTVVTRRLTSPIDASSLFDALTLGPPASVYGWWATPVPGSGRKFSQPRDVAFDPL